MMVRDSRTPRGRLEDDPQRVSFLEINDLGVSPLSMGQGRWSHDFLFDKNPRPSQAGVPLARNLRVVCPIDGSVFDAANHHATYCSNRCKMKARRMRQKVA